MRTVVGAVGLHHLAPPGVLARHGNRPGADVRTVLRERRPIGEGRDADQMLGQLDP